MKWGKEIGFVALSLAFMIVWTGLWGWAFTKTWEWFIHPMGLPVLRFSNAFGVGLLFALVSESHGRGERDAAYVGSVVLRPFLVLGMGWVVKVVFG